MNDPIVKPLSLQQICLDQRARPRVSIDQQAVDEYARDINEGAVFPPITVFYDGTRYWLADGVHRHRAHQQAGAATINVEVREGTLKDAILHSVSANATHGLRRSNADKRRAIRVLLEDDDWRTFSDTEIATRCRVSRPLIAAVRKELEEDTSHPAELQDRRMVKRGGKTYPMALTRIRRKRGEVELEKGHLAENQDKVVTFSKTQVTRIENIGSKPKEPLSITKPEPMAEAPLAEGVIDILRRIYDDFSALPTATKVASLINEQQAPFTGKQASEVSSWFRILAHLLDGGSSENLLRPRSSFHSYHSGMGTQE